MTAGCEVLPCALRKEKKRKEKKDSDDFFHDPGYAPRVVKEVITVLLFFSHLFFLFSTNPIIYSILHLPFLTRSLPEKINLHQQPGKAVEYAP